MVTVTGPESDINRFITEMKAKGIAVSDVQYPVIPLHSPAMINLAPMLSDKLNEVSFEVI